MLSRQPPGSTSNSDLWEVLEGQYLEPGIKWVSHVPGKCLSPCTIAPTSIFFAVELREFVFCDVSQKLFIHFETQTRQSFPEDAQNTGKKDHGGKGPLDLARRLSRNQPSDKGQHWWLNDRISQLPNDHRQRG